jgi:hypothetical protein
VSVVNLPGPDRETTGDGGEGLAFRANSMRAVSPALVIFRSRDCSRGCYSFATRGFRPVCRVRNAPALLQN